MSTSAIGHQQLTDLRRRASSRLTGDASAASMPFAASDALAVLHDLASSPDTAADALALLHELQVHQVELELQAEELRESRIELETMLSRQIALYDGLPVGCFTVDRSLSVHELNLRGAAMLGVSRDEAYGMHLDGFLSTDSGRRLHALLSEVVAGAGPVSATLRLLPREGKDRAVRADLSADPDEQRVLVVLTTAD